jgi:iron(III) transport system substrate-binding protein
MRFFRDFEFACAAGLILLALPRPAAAEVPASVVEGAKKEGEVVLYGTFAGQATRTIRELFEKTYGVRVSIRRGDSEDLLNRLAKAKGSDAPFDVAAGNDAAMVPLEEKGLLEPFEPPAARKFPKQLVPANRGLTPWRVFAFGLNYNTQRLTAAQAPKHWEELLDPKWKRKFLVPNPALHASTLQFMLNLEKLLGPKWLSVVQGWAKQRPRIARDPAEEIPTLTSGEIPVAIGYIKDKFQFAGPIDFVKMDRYLVTVSYIAVSRGAPHPNAARLFTDFFLGPEPQQIIANLGDYVLHPDVEDRFRSEVTDDQLVPMRLPSPAERAAWTKKFREMFKYSAQ